MPTTIPGGGGLDFAPLLASISSRYEVIAQTINPAITISAITVIASERALEDGTSRVDVDTEDVRDIDIDTVLKYSTPED